MSGRRLGSRGKELVANLLAFFEEERDRGGPFIPITSVRERVATALKLNISTVTAVSQSIKKGISFTSKTRVLKKPVTNVDEATTCAIRNKIYRMYETHQHITLDTLLANLKEYELFNGSRTSLATVMNNIGFVWKKDNPRRALMELPDVVHKRFRFLTDFMRTLNENVFQFVFLDETWIFQNGTISRSWQNDDLRSVKSTRVDGKRYIVLHAGNESGFIDGAELIFSSSTKSDDYHGEMNETNFLNWFEHKLLKNLEAPSTIVLDNASYHSTVVNKVPTSASRKGEIIQWLQNNNIVFDPHLYKPDLLNIVAMNKPPKIFKVDALAGKYGHKVLRLPPYHCIFNPIEHIWSITKTYYNRHIGRDGKSIENCLAMWKEALATATPDVWANCVKHARELVVEWFEREVKFDQEDVAPLVIAVGDDDTSTEDD